MVTGVDVRIGDVAVTAALVANADARAVAAKFYFLISSLEEL